MLQGNLGKVVHTASAPMRLSRICCCTHVRGRESTGRSISMP
jgi:hypothetical protein